MWLTSDTFRPRADIDVVHSLRLAPSDNQPPGFPAWIDRHVAVHDPIIRNKTAPDGQTPFATDLTSPPSTWKLGRYGQSYKCSDVRCAHYIYGFETIHHRDNHIHTQVVAVKRDSGLSMGNSPTVIAPRHNVAIQPLTIPESSQHTTILTTTRRASLPPHPSPLTITTTQHQSPQIGQSQHQAQPTPSSTLTRERRGSSVSSSFPQSHSIARKGSTDSDVDPLLPPLKRSRVGHSRLQSIGELQLLKDDDACIRCRLANRQVRMLQKSTSWWLC